jgi:uridine kinase
MKRSVLLDSIAHEVALLQRPHAVRVAIDGVDGAGKTTLADELVDPLRGLGVTVIRASIDGFHNPRSVRYRLGRQSPEGYFCDSFDYGSLFSVLLAPLGPGGSHRFRRAVFDYRTDSAVSSPIEIAPPRAVLLFDGVFLLRPELLPYWDFSIFLDCPFHISVPRMARRDGGSPALNSPENLRYVDGQKLYLQSCDPRRMACLVIDNTDLASPKMVANR